MRKTFFTLISIFIVHVSFAQTTLPKDTFAFTTVKENKITPIKNQESTGTCWSFSGLAFFESELLRMGKGNTDLSEMFVVSHSYTDKADKYVRTNGTINFAQGGSFYDVIYVLKNYGIGTRAYLAVLDMEKVIANANRDVVYQALPKFPALTRDIAMLVKEDVTVKEIADIIKKNGGKAE